MQYKVEDLQDTNRFKLIRILRYQEIVEFVFENIRKTNNATRLYYFVSLLTFAFIAGLTITGFKNEIFSFKGYASSFFWGLLAGSFFIIPVHELLHGLAYKLKGAPRINMGADLKQGIFYVAADKFVIGKEKFFFVALFPFIIINIIALLLIPFTNPTQLITLFYFLFFHNMMCIGDFAMMSFFIENKGKELYTYDDHKEKTSYIYELISPLENKS